MTEKVLLMFSTCVPVKGPRRSIVCDLLRSSFKLIPNDLYRFIKLYNGVSIDRIRMDYSKDELKVINEYIDFLLENEFAFLCDLDERNLFPPINYSWDYPALISNGIIDLNENSCHDFYNIFSQYEAVGCKHLMIRSFGHKSISFWDDILSLTINSTFVSIEIVTKYLNEYSYSNILDFTNRNKRIRSITFTSALYTREDLINNCRIIYTINDVNSNSHCGVITPSHFVVDYSLFFESHEYNNCLNRKICIDIDGSIKNCPSLTKTYGNIADVNLIDIALLDDFKTIWKTDKSRIHACNLCEFRYICTDCRAFLSEDSSLSKPKKCNYDPFSAKWVVNEKININIICN